MRVGLAFAAIVLELMVLSRNMVRAEDASPGPNLRGRMVVAPADNHREPYRFIGRITAGNRPNGLIGSATLIGPKHILTAAHVIENAPQHVIFVLPDGRQSPIVKAELDGGYRYKLVSMDFAICTLADVLCADGQHACWGVFEDQIFGKDVHFTAYDADLALGTVPPSLITRSGKVGRMSVHMKVGLVPGGAALWATSSFKKARKLGLGIPAVSVMAGGAFVGHQFDRLGWTGDFNCFPGASGGPIWIDNDDGRPIIIGVQSAVHDWRKAVPLVESEGLGKGMGSRITAGAAEIMVRDHILNNP